MAADEGRSSWTVEDMAALMEEAECPRNDGQIRYDLRHAEQIVRRSGSSGWQFIGPTTRLCLTTIAQDTDVGRLPMPDDYVGS
jgi:hypothetical protein